VTHYNRLMWDNGDLPTRVIEHSVVIDESARYTGSIESGIVVVNHIDRRSRAVGFDLFSEIRRTVPMQLAGMGSEALGGLGDIPYRNLHRTVANYRFLFSPMRYTSLPLAVIEAMTIGMPVVALPTTEVPSVIEDGVTGFLSSDPAVLVEKMGLLLEDPALANRLGNNAREVALRRFGWERFTRDWNKVLEEAVSQQANVSLPSAGVAAGNGSPAPVGAGWRDRTEPS
jgi:glycosyltransferase involved in cell wall biosynthesis